MNWMESWLTESIAESMGWGHGPLLLRLLDLGTRIFSTKSLGSQEWKSSHQDSCHVGILKSQNCEFFCGKQA